MNIKPTNDIDKLYDSGLIENDDGTFSCPVCNKVYKRRKSAEEHLESRDCFSLLDMFKDTANEMKGYGLYKGLILSANPKARTTINTFRKSKYYNSVMRYVSFAGIHELKERTSEYLDWLIEFKNFSNINGLLSNAIKESFLREFRLFLQKHGHIMIDSAKFYDRYNEDLSEDSHFFIRSIEKGHIWIGYFGEVDFDIDGVYDSLPADYQIRFDKILKEIE